MLSAIKTKLKGWRTVVWNSFIGSAGVLLVLADQLQTVDWSKVFTPTVCGLILFSLSIAAILLRIVTTSSIGAK